MRTVAWFLLLLFCSAVEGAEGLRCGLMCNSEVQYAGLSWRQGVGMGLSFPLELYQPDPVVFWRQQTESTAPLSDQERDKYQRESEINAGYCGVMLDITPLTL